MIPPRPTPSGPRPSPCFTEISHDPSRSPPPQIKLDREKALEIVWSDGEISTIFTLTHLRTLCPCAACKEVRARRQTSPIFLTILPGNYATPLKVETVPTRRQRDALRLEWSDQHGSGIYSFQYLRKIMPKK